MIQTSSIIKLLVENSTLIGSIGGLAGVLSLLWTIAKDRRDRKKSAAEAVAKFHKESAEFGASVKSVPRLLEIWDKKLPMDQAQEARTLMKEAYRLYHGIYSQHKARNFPPEDWKSAMQEMKSFLSHPYIEENLPYADNMNKNFGEFMRSLAPKSKHE